MEYHVTIKDLPENERPRERLAKHGVASLSNSELLAIILRTGSQKRSAVHLAQEILSRFGGLRQLAQADIQELISINGIGDAKAAQIKAAFEFSRRLTAFTQSEKPRIVAPADAANLIMDDMRLLPREEMRVLILDTKSYVLAISTVTTGTLNSNLSHPRETFREAIQKNAAGIILAHNHPSGDPTPSHEDIVLTNRYVEAGKIIGIPIVDHVIIGDGKFFSLREEGYIQ